ncbi:MAG: gliding motility-associated C-terminal domain-containing protein [Saprospiraceae bacterium]|nr:gliding motility-associated C-terminal domain-containing protein [Saprospiraceae bacterium]
MCKGEYSAYSIPFDPAATEYVWTFNGGNILNGQGTYEIDVEWTTLKDTASVCVYAKGVCKNSKQTCFKAKIVQAPKQPIVSGTAFICASNTNYVYKNDIIDPNANYSWTQTGGTIISKTKDSIIINWINETTGIVKVDADNVCGNKNDDIEVKVYKIPNAQAGDDQKLCQFETTINTNPSIGNGTWTIINKPSNSNASLSTTKTGTIFQSNSCGIYDMIWKEDNNGCFDLDTVSVNVSLPPKVSNVSVICDTSKTFYTVSFTINGCGNSFLVKNLVDGKIKTVNVAPYNFVSDPLPDSSTFKFVVYGDNECVSDTISGAKLCSCPTNAGDMSNLVLSACEDGTVKAVHKGNQVLQIDDTFEFIMHTNPGTQLGTIIDRNKTGEFKFINPPMKLENTYYISYVAGNVLANGQVDLLNDLCLSIAPGQPVIFHGYPKPIAGADFTICGDSATIEAVADAPKGSWKLISGPGIAVFDQTNNSKTFVKVSKFGAYVFEWTSDNFGCTGKDDMKVEFFPDDLQVTTPIKSCDSLGLSYIMKFSISGGQPPYSVNGVQIVGNQYVSAPILAGDPFDFNISDANNCESKNLSGIRECDCIAEVFSINANDACENEVINVTGTGKKGGKDISEYLLTTGVDLKLPSTKILQRNQTGQFIFNVGMTCGVPYYAHYVVARQDPFNPQQVKLNDTCLADISKPVVFNCTPKVDAGVKDSICGQSYDLAGSWTLGIGVWSKIAGPGQNTFADPNSANTKVDVTSCGLYKYQLFADNNGCKNSDTVEIDFSNPPTDVNRIATCNNIFTEYVVTFNIIGCGGPYKVLGMNGGTVNGTTFTSNPIPSDTLQYNFDIIDAFGCKTAINGTKNCQCLNTEVGTMPSNVLKVCVDDNGNGFVQATNDNNSKFDPNDTYEYILTDTCSSKKVGVIFDRNKTGKFSFVSPMKFGKTYYIAFGVGDSLNNGQLNLVNNKCLGFVWEPVIFYKCPTAKCPPTDTIYCGLQHNLKATASVGVGKWTVLSKPAGSIVTIGNQNSAGTSLKVSEYGDYTLQWLEDNFGYRDSCNVSFKFIYIPAPKVNGQPIIICNSQDTTYTVSYDLTSSGGNLQLLTGSNAGTFNGQTFTSNPIKSDLSYQFAIKTEESCDTLFLSGDHHCYCKATAGNSIVSAACEGDDVLFNLVDILKNEDVGGKWESLQLVNGFNSANATFRTLGVPSGTYLFRYGLATKATPPSCLGDSAIVRIVINQKPFADAGIDKLINCKVPTTELGGNQSTGGANINYLWTGPATSKPTSKFTIASNGGNYFLKVYNSVTGCFDLDTVNIIAKTSKPEADFKIKIPSCKGKLDAGVSMKVLSGEFPLTYKMNGVKALWDPSWTSLDLGIKVPGTYPIELEDVNGCKTKDSIIVPDGENFSVDLGPDLIIEFGDSAIIEAILKKITKDSIFKIEWKPNIPTIPGNPLAVVAKPELWHEYCLTIYNKAYCKAEDCVLVSIQNDKEVFIPNIFTPGDDDGTNDYFTLFGNKNVDKIETLQIFDRWGNLLFKRDAFNHSEPDLGWDGRFQNKDMNPGVYVYWSKVRFKDGTNKVFKGDITLLRK